jgi:hypothetical protein
MSKELVDVKVVIERHGTDKVLAQRSMSVTSKMLDPEHRDNAQEVVDKVGLRVQEMFGLAYMEACPAPNGKAEAPLSLAEPASRSDTPTES